MFNITPKKKQPDMYDRIHVVGDPIVAELSNRIANPPEGSVKMKITPRVAEAMIEYNTRNRPMKGGKVELYARQMAAGDWHYTRVPIIFSDAGRVIDGQHRLQACIQSGVSIEADVAFGAPDDSFAYIDVGAPRTASDIFAINGEKNSVGLAAMSRIVWQYDQGRNTVSGGTKITSAELYDEFLKMDGLADSLPIFHKFQRSRLAPPSLMGAMHYICARRSRREADRFFTEVNDGGKGNGPAVEMHRRLIKNATASEKITTDNLAGLILTAWNKDRRGLSGRGLKFTGGKLPAVQ